MALNQLVFFSGTERQPSSHPFVLCDDFAKSIKYRVMFIAPIFPPFIIPQDLAYETFSRMLILLQPIFVITSFSSYAEVMDAAPDTSNTATARPELGDIENGIASTAVLRHRLNPTPPETSIDVLEIAETSEPHVQWHQGLNHGNLIRRFSDVGSRSLTLVVLQS